MMELRAIDGDGRDDGDEENDDGCRDGDEPEAHVGPRTSTLSQIVSRHCAPPSRRVACAQDGQRVLLKGYAGVVCYRGETHFGAGEWVGVELDPQVASLAPIGKNDGSVQV